MAETSKSVDIDTGYWSKLGSTDLLHGIQGARRLSDKPWDSNELPRRTPPNVRNSLNLTKVT